MQGMPGDIIKLAGGISIFDDIEAGWATPSWEEVVERDPDVILILEYTGGDVADKKEFPGDQRVHQEPARCQRRKNLLRMLQ